MIQVAHFEPDEIILRGEGVFPRIALDLPRTPDANLRYQDWVKEAKENLQKPVDVKPEVSGSMGAVPGVSSHRMLEPAMGQVGRCASSTVGRCASSTVGRGASSMVGRGASGTVVRSRSFENKTFIFYILNWNWNDIYIHILLGFFCDLYCFL